MPWGASLGSLGGSFWALLGSYLGLLAASGLPGPLLALLGPFLARSWGPLGPLLAALGPLLGRSWVDLGPLFASLDPLLGLPGPLLGPLGPLLAAKSRFS